MASEMESSTWRPQCPEKLVVAMMEGIRSEWKWRRRNEEKNEAMDRPWKLWESYRIGVQEILPLIKLCNSCLIGKSPDTTQHAFNGPQSTKPVSGSKESETANQIFTSINGLVNIYYTSCRRQNQVLREEVEKKVGPPYRDVIILKFPKLTLVTYGMALIN